MAFLILRRLLLILALAAATVAPAFAEINLRLYEQEIKAGLLYSFLKYTVWPAASADAPMTVCIFGNDPFDGYLKPMTERTVNQREIAIRKTRSIEETGNCQMLFVNAAEKNQWPRLRKALLGKPVLTVSDLEGFTGEGGMIEFGHRDNRISATLNIDAVQSSGLRVEDRLLKLVTVTGERP